MADLIDRAALAIHVCSLPRYLTGGKGTRVSKYGLLDPHQTLEAIKSAPTVPAAPVVHARWASKPHWTLDKCSNCGKSGFPEWPYCPGCGAKMRMTADAPARGEGSGHV